MMNDEIRNGTLSECIDVIVNSPNSLMIRSANFFVRSKMSHGRPSSFIIHHSEHHSAFIIHHFLNGKLGSISTGMAARASMAVTMAGLTAP